MKPYLRDHVPQKLSEIPDTTAFEAGYLVTKNAGWRSRRPVINRERCVGCLQCYLYCPDGVIYKDGGKEMYALSDFLIMVFVMVSEAIT